MLNVYIFSMELGVLPPPATVKSSPAQRSAAYASHRAERRHLLERLAILAFFGDLVVTVAMLLFSYALRFHTKLKFIGLIDPRVTLYTYSGQLALGLGIMMVLLVRGKIYQPQRLTSFIFAASGIAKASFYWLLSFIALALLLRFDPSISRLYCMVAFVYCMIGLLTWRLLLCRYLRRTPMAGRIRERVLFVGWTEDCNKISHLLLDSARKPYEVIGVVPISEGYSHVPPAAIPQLGKYNELESIFNEQQIDVVFMADLSTSRDELARLANLCEKELIDYKIIPSAFQILLSGLHLETLNGVPVLGVSRLPLQSLINQSIKRVIDVCGALFGIIVGAPIMAIFGYLVHRESPGPIFYKQVRVGRNGQLFTIYKIRSMRLDAEADGQAGWSTKEDPRRLAIGSTIRKWNIDEIPQFWNVLKGEMSLVGPRPERPELITNFREIIPHYNARHNIKPGITGWAQINGLRGNTDLTERIKCDIFYIENWNILLDFQIMVLTFIKRDNAY
jgi:exopolysaccharide biosynthesis polyprenyl glycosylphosphotransferase